jgi:GR25 family glycosyltransferase involved in LPS biosynthesis
MNQIKIFIINLKRSGERRHEIERLLEKYSITFEFIEAIDGNQLSEEIITESRKRSNNWYQNDWGSKYSMKLGEIGAALSHMMIYKRIISENIDAAIILEDDILFEKKLQQFVNNVESIFRALQFFDLILLGYTIDGKKFRLPAQCSYWGRKKIANKLYVGIPLKWYWSAIGYIINRKAASLLLKKQGDYPCVTADILTANSPGYGVKLGVLSKPIIWPGLLNDFSTIQEQVNKENIKTNELNLNNIDFVHTSYTYRKLKNWLRIQGQKLKRKHYSFVSKRY